MLKPIVRQYVSGDRRRYKAEDGTNLDLTYIRDNIIAMSFPASGFIETVWRNSIHTVGAFLVKNHGDNFMVFNVSERTYNGKKMKKQMIHIPFADHHPPPLVQFFETVTMIDAWLRSSAEHVAIIHCVGGKGRTGTIISALMFYDCTFPTAEDSAEHFARSRSVVGRGVTQPSQKRYLGYFERFLTGEMLNFCPVMIKQFILVGLISERYSMEIYDSPWDGNLKFQYTHDYDSSIGPCIILINLQAYGDIYIKLKVGKTTVFRSCLHTYFINEDNIVFTREEIDGLDTNFLSGNIQLAMTFAQVANARHRQPNTIFIKALKEFKTRRQMSPFGAIPDKIAPVNSNILANSSGRPRVGEIYSPHVPPPLPPPPSQGFSAPKLGRGGALPPLPSSIPATPKPAEWTDKRATAVDTLPRSFSMYQSPGKRQRFPTMRFESLMEEIEKCEADTEPAVPSRGVIGVGRVGRSDEAGGRGARIGGRGTIQDGDTPLKAREVGSMGSGRFEVLMRKIERYSHAEINPEDEEDDLDIPPVVHGAESSTTESSDDSFDEYELQQNTLNDHFNDFVEVEVLRPNNNYSGRYYDVTPELKNEFIDVQVYNCASNDNYNLSNTGNNAENYSDPIENYNNYNADDSRPKNNYTYNNDSYANPHDNRDDRYTQPTIVRAPSPNVLASIVPSIVSTQVSVPEHCAAEPEREDKVSELKKKQQKLQELQLKLQQLQQQQQQAKQKKEGALATPSPPLPEKAEAALDAELTSDPPPDNSPKASIPRVSPERNLYVPGGGKPLPSPPPSPTVPGSSRPVLPRRSGYIPGENAMIPQRSPRAVAKTAIDPPALPGASFSLANSDSAVSRQTFQPPMPPHLAQRQTTQPLPPHGAQRQAQPLQYQLQSSQIQQSGRSPLQRQKSQPEVRPQIHSQAVSASANQLQPQQPKPLFHKHSSTPDSQRQQMQQGGQWPQRTQTSSNGSVPQLNRISASSQPAWAAAPMVNRQGILRPNQTLSSPHLQPDHTSPRSAFTRAPPPTLDLEIELDPQNIPTPSPRSQTRSSTSTTSPQQLQQQTEIQQQAYTQQNQPTDPQDDDDQKRMWPPRKPAITTTPTGIR